MRSKRSDARWPLRSIVVPAAACSVTLAVVATSRQASAFCREVTEETPLGYDPVDAGCWYGASGAALDVYWRNACVSYSIQKNGTHWIPLPIVKEIAAQAFGAWNQVTCSTGQLLSITATELEPPEGGAVDCDEVQYNKSGPNQHVIVFRDDGWPYPEDAANVLGFTTVQYASATGEIVDADMEINSANFELVPLPPVVAGKQPMQVDLLSVLTHEAGHFLGLAHSGALDAMMYAFYAPGAVLGDDDVAGICSIYNPDGTRVTSAGPVAFQACDPTPLGGFTSECAPDGGWPSGAAADDAGTGTGVTSDVPSGSGSGACAVAVAVAGARHGAPGAGWVGAIGLALAAARRRARRLGRAGERASRAGAIAVSLLAGSAGTLAARPARASVALAAALEELVDRSDGAAVVTPVERSAAVEDGRIYTWTHVRVDRTIAGTLPGDVWIRTRGGEVGAVGERVEGEARFVVGARTLVFLRAHAGPSPMANAFVVIERAQGEFLVVAGDGGPEHLAGIPGVGAIVVRPGETRALASAVLAGRTVDDAAAAIAAAWRGRHPR